MISTQNARGAAVTMTTSLSHYKLSRKEIARHKCIDCGVNVIKSGDYCMINPEIWKRQLGLGWTDNLCIACIEARIGRKLTLVDFCGLASVEGFGPSDILVNRLGLIRGRKRKR
jgi:hypothetical protein